MVKNIIPDSDCFDVDVDYFGSDIKMKSGIGSSTECFLVCMGFSGCNYFTYHTVAKYCYLKFAKSGYLSVSRTVSGGVGTCKGID